MVSNLFTTACGRFHSEPCKEIHLVFAQYSQKLEGTYPQGTDVGGAGLAVNGAGERGDGPVVLFVTAHRAGSAAPAVVASPTTTFSSSSTTTTTASGNHHHHQDCREEGHQQHRGRRLGLQRGDGHGDGDGHAAGASAGAVVEDHHLRPCCWWWRAPPSATSTIARRAIIASRRQRRAAMKDHHIGGVAFHADAARSQR